jgi:hypothetical protein
MEDNYIIEVTMPDTGEIKYLTAWNDLISDPNGASKYVKRSVAAAHKIENLPRSLNPRLVDRRMVIGTYISTYKGKFRFERIVDIVCRNNVTAILSLPILLPIALFIRFRKMYNQYVTNHR